MRGWNDERSSEIFPGETGRVVQVAVRTTHPTLEHDIFNRKFFGALRAPSRQGRVRCTHQQQGKSNRIMWRCFHRRHFLGVNPLVCFAHCYDGAGCVVCTNTMTNHITSRDDPSTYDSSVPCHYPYIGAHGAPLSVLLGHENHPCRTNEKGSPHRHSAGLPVVGESSIRDDLVALIRMSLVTQCELIL